MSQSRAAPRQAPPTRPVSRRRPPGTTPYAIENKRRQIDWERGFRLRIEEIIADCGGVGRVTDAIHLSPQTFQKIRRGGSRLAFLAVFAQVTGLNLHWLLFGSPGEEKFRRSRLSRIIDEELEQEVESAAEKKRKLDSTPSNEKKTVGNPKRLR